MCIYTLKSKLQTPQETEGEPLRNDPTSSDSSAGQRDGRSKTGQNDVVIQGDKSGLGRFVDCDLVGSTPLLGEIRQIKMVSLQNTENTTLSQTTAVTWYISQHFLAVFSLFNVVTFANTACPSTSSTTYVTSKFL